ncbi:MAG: DUF2178 domain-containing protein [Candidatus Shapirobacteria bacterium]|nr:DUF2178 domain-containing protein [Candidatus Shapirobacteria bacterium]
MTLKKYNQIRLAIVIIISIVVGQSIVLENYLMSISTVAIGSLVLLFLRRQVKEVVADERDYALTGKSASWAIQIYSWIAVIAMFILYAFKNLNPSYEPIALTLAYSTCALMLIYSLIYKFINKIKFTPSKSKFIVFIIILAIFLGIFTVRLFSGEDNWVCQKGEWIQHGHPDFSAPTIPCK